MRIINSGYPHGGDQPVWGRIRSFSASASLIRSASGFESFEISLTSSRAAVASSGIGGLPSPDGVVLLEGRPDATLSAGLTRSSGVFCRVPHLWGVPDK